MKNSRFSNAWCLGKAGSAVFTKPGKLYEDGAATSSHMAVQDLGQERGSFHTHDHHRAGRRVIGPGVTASPQAHPGRWFWTRADPDYRAIRQWIAEGAQNSGK